MRQIIVSKFRIMTWKRCYQRKENNKPLGCKGLFLFPFNQTFENTETWPIPQKCFPDHSFLHADKHKDYASSWKKRRHWLFLILEHESVCVVIFLSSYLRSFGGLFFFLVLSFFFFFFCLFCVQVKLPFLNAVSPAVSAWTANTWSTLCYCIKHFACL